MHPDETPQLGQTKAVTVSGLTGTERVTVSGLTGTEMVTVSGLTGTEMVVPSFAANGSFSSPMWISQKLGEGGPRTVSPNLVLEDLRQTPTVFEAYDTSSLQQVGQGGMSVVFAALHQDLNRFHAIKVMTRPITDETLQSFRDEARRLAQLDHPNVIKVHQTGRTPSGRPFFIMTFVPGGQTVKDKIRSYHEAHGNRVTSKEWRRENHPLLGIITQVLSALEDVHKIGFVHRDIKPSNILVATPSENSLSLPPNQVFLADFGLSTNTTGGSNGPAAQSFEGTPQYAAPEQVDPSVGPIALTTDLYQMGLVLREALTGRAPFEGESRVDEIIKRISSTTSFDALYGNLLATAPNTPPELRAIVERSLARDPRQRYQSAAEFRNDLLAFQHGGRVLAYQQSLPATHNAGYNLKLMLNAAANWAQHHRAATAALAAATLLAGGGLELQRRNQKEQTATAIAKAKLIQLHKIGNETLERSRDATQRGQLEDAQALIWPALLESLRSEGDPKSLEILQIIQAEYDQRQSLLSLRKSTVEGYLASVQSSNPRDFKPPDRQKLERAQKIYFPLGLTEEGISDFAARMSKCSLALREKIEILDTLTELSFMLFEIDFPKDQNLNKERYNEAVSRMYRIKDIAEACNLRVGGTLVKSSALDGMDLIFDSTRKFPLAKDKSLSGLPLRCDNVLNALAAVPRLTGPFNNDLSRKDAVYASSLLEAIEEPNPSNVGASLRAATLQLNADLPDATTKALQSTMNAIKAARKVNVEHFYLKTRAILIAGDLARHLRAELFGATTQPTGSLPLLQQVHFMALELLAQTPERLSLDIIEAHVTIARILVNEPISDSVERLCRSPEYSRRGELAKLWVQLSRIIKKQSSDFDKELWQRVVENRTNHLEEPVTMMTALDHLGRYDDVVRLMRDFATRKPAFKEFLWSGLSTKDFVPKTLEARLPDIQAIIETK